MTLRNKGIISMLLGVIILSVMDAVVKWLVMHNVEVIMILAVRGWMIITALTIYLFFAKNNTAASGFSVLKTDHPWIHLIRAVIGFFAPFLFFTSLEFIPLADATAIFFCTTFFMTAGSVPFLGERVGVYRWLAIITGFIGVLLITRPGTDVFHPASLLALGAGAAYAFMVLAGRLLSRKDSTFKLVFYFNLAYTVIATVMLPFFWQALDLSVFGFIIIVAILAVAGHFALTTAFASAPVAIIAPYEYTAMIWAICLGYLIWGDIPTQLAWAGIALITAAGLFIAWREQSNNGFFEVETK